MRLSGGWVVGRGVLAFVVLAVVVAGPVGGQVEGGQVDGEPAAEPLPSVVAAVVDGSDARAGSRIVVTDPDGSVRTVTGGAIDVAPVASPDGSRALFVRLAAAGDATGELGLVDLDSGEVDLTGITVDRSAPLLWVHDAALVATTPDGIVEIRPDFRFVAFVPGTAAGQTALDTRLLPVPEGAAPAPPRILAWRLASSGPQVQLLELDGSDAPTVLATPEDFRFTIAAAAYGPAGTIAFVSTVSTSAIGTQQFLHFLDAEGDLVQDASYGGDGGLHLLSGPEWRPDGAGVLFGGTGIQRFPGRENSPAALVFQAPGEGADAENLTAENPAVLRALGWRPDASATVGVLHGTGVQAAVLVTDPGGEVLHAVELPGDLPAPGPEGSSRFGTGDADLLPPIRRVGGEDRVTTAIEVSEARLPSGGGTSGPLAEQVVLARGDVYADALAGAPLALELGAPLLLTGQHGLDERVADEIARLGATRAVLLGGEAALSAAVARDLESHGLAVRRLAGPDRFATAAAIAGEMPAAERVVLVQGIDADPARGWPDAVSAGPYAAAAGVPLLLTGTDQLPQATAEALAARSPATVVVVGGPAAVSEATADAAAEAAGPAAVVQRIAGPDRVATSVAVAEAQIAAGTGSAASLWVATADEFPDALAAGPAVAADGGVLLLTPLDPTGSALEAFLLGTESRVARLVGGRGAIGYPPLPSLLLGAGLGGPDAHPLDVG